jgi:WD40 repeat protein
MTETTRRRYHRRMYTLLFGTIFAAVRLAVTTPPTGTSPRSAPTAAHPELTLRIHPEDMVMSLAVSPDNSTLAAATQYGDWGGVEVWDLTSGGLRWATAGNNGGVEAVAYSPDGRQLASGGEDGVLRLWNVRTGKLERRLGRQGLVIRSIAFSPDSRSIATAGGDPLEDEVAELKLWDLRTFRLRRSRRTSGDFLNPVAFLPPAGPLPRPRDGIGTLWLWDTRPGRRSWLVVGYDPTPSQLSPDRKMLAVAGGTVELLDARTLAPLGQLLRGAAALVFSPDSRTVATATDSERESKLEVWSARTAKLQHSIGTHWSRVSAIAYLPNDPMLVSGDQDGALGLWDISSGRLLLTLQLLSWPGERSAAAQWIAFTPDGYYNGSPGVTCFIRWRVGHQLFPGARYERLFHRPDLIQRVLGGKSLSSPSLGPVAGVR